MHDVMLLFVAVNSPMCRYCSVTFSVTVPSSDNVFIFRNVDGTVAGNIETMTIYLQYIIWMNAHLTDALLTLLILMCFTPHSNDMTSWQNSSAEKISCNVAPFFYHHSVVIQHLVSDRLLSLNSKENVQNVR